MPEHLTFEDGLVKLGNTLLPGILRCQSIRCGVRYDESKHDAMSGKAKVALGWEDAGITLTLDLLCDEVSDCYAKLTAINKVFKATGGKKATPQIYNVTGRHLRARGISRVVFDALDSTESDDDDVIQVQLTFIEHIPAVVKREKRANAVKATGTTTPPATKATPAPAPGIVEDTTNPLLAGIKAGMN
ncbi:hypothetical protein [Geobacter sp. SVR]|uniref:hypothetical protein n=1 Tax=Geobacter sp. SVR TaxID=2495594 RepID=UPI00143EF9B8|nr:hypothetical protein [Geobacter sp. SVR]BCS54565.1 hypothetical protein GSVR_28730 [Geobacter sp. SVR]GCF86928.1 hypothetical protein GSbR_35280 [Geobacter sp. SVR]